MPRIWDYHVHFPRARTREGEPEEPQSALDHLAERLREVGVVRANLLCPTTRAIGPSYRLRTEQSDNRAKSPSSPKADPGNAPVAPLTHESCIDMASKHGDLFVPHAVVDPEVTTFERVQELHRMGYRGLKIIGTRRAYDSRDYFPVYRAAEQLSMPILFHCGVIGGGLDWLARHPRRDPESAKRMRETDERQRKEAAGEASLDPAATFRMGPRETSAMNMRPFHLETLANRFPRLRIVGAHLGGTGNYDEAASVARWRRWVYFDLSGGRTIERHAIARNLIGGEIAIEKLVFGSDCPADEVHEHVERFERIFDELGLSDEEKELIWYRNAAELFGEEVPSWAEE